MLDNVIYKGKKRILYEGENDNTVVIYFKDDLTSYNMFSKEIRNDKGVINNKISTIIFDYLKQNGIYTHHICTLDNHRQLCVKVNIIPLEFKCRNVVAGSAVKRLGLEQGLILDEPVVEIYYKRADLQEYLINDTHALALKIVSKEQLAISYDLVYKINDLLRDLFIKTGIILVDFRVEFGVNSTGLILLAADLSSENCRLCDFYDKDILDEDIVILELDGAVLPYETILKRLAQVNYLNE